MDEAIAALKELLNNADPEIRLKAAQELLYHYRSLRERSA